MSITAALAAVAVTDLAEAKDYYSRLFGRPADVEPMPTLAQWDLPSGSLQVVELAETSGRSMVTLMIEDFDETLTWLTANGFAPGETVPGVISRVTQATDPAGNVITFAEVLDPL